ncbi:MAG: tetratricopeptide repeat protein [Gammaproteobacteria bacterium]|nr:tetratricopeptide repeat protein [Gammaproteobacteria bacterium]
MKIRKPLWIVALGLLLVRPALALEIFYDPARDPALRECDSQHYRGQTAEARACYTALQDSSASTLLQAEAAWALGNTREANRLFRAAARDDESDPGIKTRWGRLYAATHQVSDALALFKEALRIDSEYLPAQLATAAVMSQRFEGEVREQLQAILQAHPESLEAHLLLARLELELKDTSAARGWLDKAHKLAETAQQPLLEIHALQAAADLLDGETESAATGKSLETNPHYGGIYAIPAHFYIITYRYREAVALYRKAVEVEPELWSAHSALGINLLRINRVEEARKHLEIAYRGDPFDTATVNTLRLLDTLEDLKLVNIDVDYSLPAADGSGAESHKASVLIRLDQDEADVLEPYVREVVGEAVQTLSERYDFRLQQPLIVELYPNHDDFAVRTVSTPGVGLLGVTFGYLLAMDSPRALPEGDFHWASTLWHELVHVFTLEASGHLLPRWFGEGLSVYEEWNTGPLPGRQLSVAVLRALADDRFLPVADLDQGFIRPTYRGQINVSYMQAGLICDFIAERWGHEALLGLLRQFAAGADTTAAVKTVLNMEPAAFDKVFRQSLDARYKTVLDDLDGWQEKLLQARQETGNENWSAVIGPARQALAMLPEYVGPDNAYLSLAYALEAQGETEQAHQEFRNWLQLGGHQPEVLRSLSEKFSEHGKPDDAMEALLALNKVAPYSLEHHAMLADLHLRRQQADEALREYNVMLGLEPLDVAAIYLGKARAHRQLGQHADSRRQVLYSLEHAPFFRDAQHFLIELVDGGTS